MPVIEVEALAKTFRTRERASGFMSSLHSLVAPHYRTREALKPTSFSVESGEILAFIGPNGAGKSTTIKMLTGILHPSEGQAQVLGLVPWVQRRQLAFHIASLYGQKSQLWYHLPPQDTFDLLARIYEMDRTAYRKRRDFLIETFAIDDYLRTPARKLSLGERMRCELAAALLHKPAVVFLDEPTIGLDIPAKHRMRDLIRYLNTEEGLTVFLTSHDAGDIEQLCQRAIIINQGEMVLDTTVEALKRDYLHRKMVDLLLDGDAAALVSREASTGLQCLGARFSEPLQQASINGGPIKVISANGQTFKLEIDTTRIALEPVIASAMQQGNLIDISITAPPMDEVINLIYQQGRGMQGANSRLLHYHTCGTASQ